MKNLILLAVSTLLLLVSNGCSQKEYIYLEPTNPELITWDVNNTKLKPIKIEYEVINDPVK